MNLDSLLAIVTHPLYNKMNPITSRWRDHFWEACINSWRPHTLCVFVSVWCQGVWPRFCPSTNWGI